MPDLFKLRDCFDAHDGDVKSLFVLSDGYGFISASRDLSVRLWKEEFETFKQEKKYLFHKNFLSVVIYMNPSMDYSDGLILSAGYDKTIYGYSPLTGNVEFTLNGHSDTVTSLSIKGMELVSGSMDHTAIIWNLTSNSISSILKGHNKGIWSVLFLQCIENNLLTASADKDIFLWNSKEQAILLKFSGHTDCVRTVVELPEQKQFLSCSNDTTIRLWSLKHGTCLNEFKYHTSYIYSIAIMPESNKFVSCGEDGIVCLWNLNETSKPTQILIHNAQSVWCASFLINGDVITGASDGRIRLFSMHLNLQTGIELAPKKSKGIIDEVTYDNLPTVGIEILSLPGSYDGQPVKVMDEGKLILYLWSVSKDVWLRQNTSLTNKVSDKKTHDYVFSIDIKDGEPPLKLPYNNGQDPWVVAQKFLNDNDLSSQFLDQVANFIINNTSQTMSKSSINTFTDPFTGNNRYVPESTVVSLKMFPQKNILRFDQINVNGLSKKIIEVAGSNIVPEEILSLIENVSNLSSNESLKLFNWTIDRMTEWETELLFPLIDILRMLVRESVSNDICFSNSELLTKLFSKTISLKDECSKGNMITMIKLMCNGFIHCSGESRMMEMLQNIGDILIQSVNLFNDKTILNAISSWFLNIAVTVNVRNDDSKRFLALEMSFILLEKISTKSHSDAVLKVLVTIGTLVCNNDSFTFRENLTVGIFEKINNLTKLYQDRSKWGGEVGVCCEQLAQLVSSLDLFNF